MSQLTLGLLATSSKENELRLPIHPQHFDRIDADLRARIVLEQGYGDRYGVSEDVLATHSTARLKMPSPCRAVTFTSPAS